MRVASTTAQLIAPDVGAVPRHFEQDGQRPESSSRTTRDGESLSLISEHFPLVSRIRDQSMCPRHGIRCPGMSRAGTK